MSERIQAMVVVVVMLLLMLAAGMWIDASAAAQINEGDGCNAETGEPGLGEGIFERDIDGGLSCVAQPEEQPPTEEPDVPTPTRIDTGGGYCAVMRCE